MTVTTVGGESVLVILEKDTVCFRSNNYGLISAYFPETLLEIKDGEGLCLEGAYREYDISGEEVQKVKDWIKGGQE